MKAAIRELEEETGYIAKGVVQSTAILATDPGSSLRLFSTTDMSDGDGVPHSLSGMTTTNMQTVTLDVPLEDKLETPEQKLDEGESIVKRVVPLSGLYQELKGAFMVQSLTSPPISSSCLKCRV